MKKTRNLSPQDKRLATLDKKSEKMKRKIIDALTNNPIVSLVCKQVGISRATYYKYLAEDRPFSYAAERAANSGKLLVNDLAKSNIIQLIRDRDPQMTIFWLKHNDRDYIDKKFLEITKNKDLEMTPEEREEIADALVKTGLATVSQVHAFIEEGTDDEEERAKRFPAPEDADTDEGENAPPLTLEEMRRQRLQEDRERRWHREHPAQEN